MIPYSVNTPEYLSGEEFAKLSEFVISVRRQRYAELQARYPGMVINERCSEDNDMAYYLEKFNVPYMDMLCETIVHKDGCGYIDVDEFTYQNNCFSKTVFHRRLWTDTNEHKDTFMLYVYKQWECPEFDALAKQAQQYLDQNTSILEYHKQFVYNDKYQFATVEEVTELFDALVDAGFLLGKEGKLYKIYEGLDLDQADTNIKERYHDNALSNIDKLHIQSQYNTRTKPKLLELKTKFNLIPRDEQSEFKGMWLEHKLGGRIWFIPQFLLFYNQ